MVPKFFLLIALIGIIQMESSESATESFLFSEKLYRLVSLVVEEQNPKSETNCSIFAADLFKQISRAKPNENVIISPISVQAALAVVYFGAQEQTASELLQGLRLPWTSKEEIGKNVAEILNKKSGEAEFVMANRLFVDSSNQLQSTFNEDSQKYFNSKVEQVNFSQSSNAIETINTWIERKTNCTINNLLQSGSLDDHTSAIIANAAYFRGKWKNPFSSHRTEKRPFWVSQTTSVEADTMYINDESFRWSTLAECNATALELPYEGSDISMVIILPNERDGLSNLEEKLTSENIYELRNKMIRRDVNLWLPRFKVEYSVELVDVLKTLGISSIFEDTANLSGIFQSSPKVKISGVQHKAFIDVSEAGSEAPAESFGKISFTKFYTPDEFRVDHPFVFVIKGPEVVYFIGHVTTL